LEWRVSPPSSELLLDDKLEEPLPFEELSELAEKRNIF
jgi:hypothetical protein